MAKGELSIDGAFFTLKYEEVYLKSYRDGQDAYQQLDRYIRWYNEKRTHSALGGLTPKF